MKYLNLFIVIAICCCGCKSSQSSYKINATGQKLCYDVNGNVIEAPKVGDKLYGQDANYSKGLEMAFIDNGNGTITDVNTELMWQQTPPIEGMTWAEAKEYCENLECGGYSDWRLPTLKELFSISDFSEGWPYLDTTYFKLSNGIVSKDEQYWADNKYVGETVEGRDDAAFGVNHVTGHIKAYPAGSKMRERGADGEQRPPMQGREGEDGERPQRPQMQGGESGERPQHPQIQGGEGGARPQRPQMQGGEGGERPQRPQMQGGEEGAMPPPSMEGNNAGGRPM